MVKHRFLRSLPTVALLFGVTALSGVTALFRVAALFGVAALLGVTTLFGMTAVATAQEIPVLVQTNSNAKAMMVIDDSGSMNAIMEHPAFNATAAAVLDAGNDIPSIIYRLESGSSNPSSANPLRPVLVEANLYMNSSSSSSSMWATTTMNNASSSTLIASLSCNSTSSAAVNCPSPGPSTPQTGVNSVHLYGDTSKSGTNAFTIGNLAKSGGVNITDANGHEYLYIKYRRNDYFSTASGGEDQGDVWAKFDASGNPIVYRTRVWTTTGGTVKFNNREVFLSAGRYRAEYLRWIFYVSTAAQRAQLPGSNRITTVKNVVRNLITNNPTVKFGLMTFNGTTLTAGTWSGNILDQWNSSLGNTSTNTNISGKIRQPVGTAQATLLSSLNTISAEGGTPLTNTYILSLEYLRGGVSGYSSPITSACDGHFSVLLTDGLPSTETGRQLFGAWVSDYDGDGEDGVATNQNCTDVTCPRFADDAAFYAARIADFSSSLPGQQVVKTYTIGLSIGFKILDDMAVNGMTGHSYVTNSVEEITNALNNIVTLMVTSATAGAGAALAETFGEAGRVFRPRFRADQWTGNIDVSLFNETTGALSFQFDVAEVLAERNLSTDPRTIIAGYDPDHDGRTTQTIAFTPANAATLRPELFEKFIAGTENVALLEPPLADFSSSTAAETLIRFISGQQIPDLRIRDRNGDNSTADMGDIVYSRPVEVGPRNGNYSSMTGYNAFAAQLSLQPRILLVGANDGMLHAFDSATGREIWTYIPSSLLKHLELLSRVPYNGEFRRSYVDGPVAVEDAFISGQWRTLAMFGLRTGGSTYTVLDITDRSAPQLMFEVSDSASYGQSWSKPVIVPSNGSGNNPSSYTWNMVVGTGEGKTTAGTNIVAYPLVAGSVPTGIVKAIAATEPAGTRTTNLVPVQADNDFNVDRLYLGTEEGDLFRVFVTGATAASWTVQKLYDGDATRPIVAAPTVVLVDNPQFTGGSGIAGMPLGIGVYFGTGHYDSLADIVTFSGVSQRTIGIIDPVNTAGDTGGVLGTVTTANLQNQTGTNYNVIRDATTGIYKVPSNKAGFYIDMATSIATTTDNFIVPTGMILSEAVNIRGALLFSTFLPNTGQCQVGGYGFVQAINFRTGGGFLVDYQDARAPYYNGGVPDLDGNGVRNNADLTLGITGGSLLPAIDTKIESINMSLPNPYVHSGTLTQSDIRLNTTNGGILPTVSSLGNRGLPVTPSILRGQQKIIVQPAYVQPVEIGNPSEGGVTSPPSSQLPSSSIPPPDMLPLQIYDLPISVLSFHEVTNN